MKNATAISQGSSLLLESASAVWAPGASIAAAGSSFVELGCMTLHDRV